MSRRLGSRPRRQRPAAAASHDVPVPEPDVIVDFVFDAGMLFIVVRNIGAGAATKVSIVFNQPLVGVGGHKEISGLPVFKNVEFLPPQKEITAFLDTSASYFARNQPTKVSARVRFRDAAGRTYSREIHHDLEIYREIGYVVRPGSSSEEPAIVQKRPGGSSRSLRPAEAGPSEPEMGFW